MATYNKLNKQFGHAKQIAATALRLLGHATEWDGDTWKVGAGCTYMRCVCTRRGCPMSFEIRRTQRFSLDLVPAQFYGNVNVTDWELKLVANQTSTDWLKSLISPTKLPKLTCKKLASWL